MDLLQITLIVVLIIFALTILCVGIFFILFLVELKNTVKKANFILEDVQTVTSAVSSPVTTIAGIIASAAQSLKAVKSMKGLFNKEE